MVMLRGELPEHVTLLTEQEALDQGYVSQQITMVGGLVGGGSIRWNFVLGRDLYREFLAVRNAVVDKHGYDFSCGKAVGIYSNIWKRTLYVPADLEMKIAVALDEFLTQRGIANRY
jgi:hypothetical protein